MIQNDLALISIAAELLVIRGREVYKGVEYSVDQNNIEYAKKFTFILENGFSGNPSFSICSSCNCVPIWRAALVHRAQPYAFKYSVKDKHGEHHREEAGDGAGVVKGSYGFTDDRGISREVAYIADKAGFRPEIKTNEHGTAPQDPAATKMDSSSHPYYGGAGAKDVFKSPVGLVEHAVPYANIPHAV
ncbi:cuticle protein 16.8 [Nephila pilipes]|uniref:Cuticle protein 16.8 n=1 Tax=Nephila pilipes TaxID=299642 RepID=A0A8X6TK62_NEPPI|nr:cuticle protein 16.8 [Nephila pilipes]